MEYVVCFIEEAKNMIDIECGNCKTKLTAPDELAGKKGQCPKCGNSVDVPK
jgi:hypothetical protein